MNDKEWDNLRKLYWKVFDERSSEETDDGEPDVVSVNTDFGSYPDFEAMVDAEGEPELFEVVWSNGDITSQDGDILRKVGEGDNTGEFYSTGGEKIVELKTYAYKAHSRCRKCGTILYSTVRDFSGGTVQRSPHTHYLPALDQLRKQCGDCGYAWYELPKDYRDKSNG